MKITVCVTTYNSFADLSRAISALENQSRLPDEILICDDGSGATVVDQISALISKSKLSIRHVWHEDMGWRLSAIRNRGILVATGDYIVFVDGDCLPDKHFVRDYERFAKEGEMLIGGKIHVKERFRDFFIPGGGIHHLLWAVLGRLVNRSYVLPRPWDRGVLFSKNNKPPRGELEGLGLGCNHGFWRKDAMLVGGCEESFVSWGPEDADFVFRLMNAGVSVRRVRFHSQVFHLDHPLSKRKFCSEVDELVQCSYDGHRLFPAQSILIK